MTGQDTDPRPQEGRAARRRTAQVEVLMSAVLGAVVAAAVGVTVPLPLALLVGWDTAALAYMAWIWVVIVRQDADGTAQRATTTDPDRRVTDVLLLTAAVASLVAVGFVLA